MGNFHNAPPPATCRCNPETPSTLYYNSPPLVNPSTIKRDPYKRGGLSGGGQLRCRGEGDL